MTRSGVSKLAPVGLLLGVYAFGSARLEAQPQSLEYEVKAAYLLNFLSYTEWAPDNGPKPGDPLRICLADRDPFRGALERVVQGEQIGGRAIVVERVEGNDAVGHCAMLFIPSSVPAESWLNRTSQQTLTVGESSSFLAQGGIVGLVVDAGRVRFDVNIAAATSRKIRLSSRLLRLARRTVGGVTRGEQ